MMKCVVIYFSLTGNTEKMAKAIHTGVKQIAGHCDIIPIKEANPRRLNEYDLIGLGSPVYSADVPPLNIETFIKDMRFVGGKHVFSFCTHGTIPEHYFPKVVPMLKRQGLIVIGTRDWYCSVNLVHMPKPYPTDGHPDEIDLKEAEDFGREMVERSRRISAGETNLIPPVPPLVERVRTGEPRELVVNYHEEKCLYPKCRLCMDNCPMDGIDLTVKPPVICKPCTHCELCCMICPTGAMECDAHFEYMIMEKATRENLEKNLFSRLEKAEAEGRFRRLVPVEKIGWDTYIYNVYKKHPYWVIGKGMTYKYPQ